MEIVEENNYYPFGLKHVGYNSLQSTEGNDAAQRWKFGGKEYQADMDLDWYDVSARNYDPALGRWMNIDPLADQMRRHSPYNYAFDNPVFYIDADGMSPYGSNGYQDLDANEAYAQGAEVIQGGGGSVNISHTDSRGNATTTSMSAEAFDSILLANGGGSSSGGDSTDPKKKKKKKGNIFTHLLGKLNRFLQSIGSSDGPDEESLADVKSSLSGFQNAAQNLNTVAESFDLIGMGSPARLAAAFSNGEISVEEYYASINSYLDTNSSLTGDALMTALLILPGAAEVNIAGKGTKASVTVLGHFPEYMNLANKINARRFSIPTPIWDKMSAAERWAANKKFLDRTILRGDRIRLATPIGKIKPGSYYAMEINYLLKKGYEVKGKYLKL